MGHRAFFNVLAEKWDTICRHDRDMVNRILDLSGMAQGDAVLDVGTGTGIPKRLPGGLLLSQLPMLYIAPVFYY